MVCLWESAENGPIKLFWGWLQIANLGNKKWKESTIQNSPTPSFWWNSLHWPPSPSWFHPHWFLDLICKLLIPTHEGGNQVGGNFLTSRTRQQSPENLTVNTHIWGKYTHKYTNTNTQIHIHLGQPYQLSQYLSTLEWKSLLVACWVLGPSGYLS